MPELPVMKPAISDIRISPQPLADLQVRLNTSSLFEISMRMIGTRHSTTASLLQREKHSQVMNPALQLMEIQSPLLSIRKLELTAVGAMI